MRVSVLSVCVGVLALLSSAVALPNDFQCHLGNSNDSGVCVDANGNADPFDPAYNRADMTTSDVSFETDQARLGTVVNTDNPTNRYDAQLNVRRKVWDRSLDPNTQDGVGNSERAKSTTIGGALPAGFLAFPFQMSYRADGFALEPQPQGSETVTSTNAAFHYNTKTTPTADQPAQVSDGNSEIWYLYQPTGGFGLTAGKATLTIGGVPVPGVDAGANIYGTALPNGGVGTYYQTRRVVVGTNEPVTGNIAVTSGQALQSVGGPNAPGNTYSLNPVTNVYDRPVLSNVVTPSVGGAFITFTLTALGNTAPPAGKVFISQGVLQVTSTTPVDQLPTGVPFTGTYSLDTTTGTNSASGTFVAGTQKLYVRQTGDSTWTPLASSYNANSNVVSYTLQSSDVTVARAAGLEMTVQADLPVSSSSSTAPAAPSSSSSTASAPAPVSSSSSTASAPAAVSSSSSTASQTPAAVSSSSSTGAATPASPSSSSSTGVPVVAQVSSSSSSSSGAGAGAITTNSSSTGINGGTFPDGAASGVAASGVAVVLAAAAAVAAMYA